MFFYVPTDTQTVGFYAQAGTTVKLFDATGAQVGDTIEARFDYYAVEVQGRGGAVWKISGVNANLGLLTVPPGFALAPEELLVPREVAEEDGLVIIP